RRDEAPAPLARLRADPDPARERLRAVAALVADGDDVDLPVAVIVAVVSGHVEERRILDARAAIAGAARPARVEAVLGRLSRAARRVAARGREHGDEAREDEMAAPRGHRSAVVIQSRACIFGALPERVASWL